MIDFIHPQQPHKREMRWCFKANNISKRDLEINFCFMWIISNCRNCARERRKYLLIIVNNYSAKTNRNLPFRLMFFKLPAMHDKSHRSGSNCAESDSFLFTHNHNQFKCSFVHIFFWSIIWYLFALAYNFDVNNRFVENFRIPPTSYSMNSLSL